MTAGVSGAECRSSLTEGGSCWMSWNSDEDRTVTASTRSSRAHGEGYRAQSTGPGDAGSVFFLTTTRSVVGLWWAWIC